MSIRDLIPWKWGRKQESQSSSDSQALSTLRDDLNRLFEGFLGGVDRGTGLLGFGGGLPAGVLNPKVEVSETDDAIEISAELPGLKEEDVDVSILDGVVRIRGEKKQEREEKKKGYYVTELTYGSFCRDIPLWAEVDTDKVDARFKRGVLRLKLPKVGDSAKSKRITVRSA